jgi:hypothetical protein
MRTLLAGSLFALAVLVAACGGGGKSSVIPSGYNAGIGSGPSSSKNANAVIVLKIPAPGQQVSRRPFYLSSGTQSLGVLVVAATSSESPTPTDLTIYPVATPSPCATATGGGYTCTLNVTAPIGVDNFFVGAFATASPNANAVPLSEYAALGITVSASPAPNATPLTFTLDGVVYKVVLTVPSPDPGNTPNTQAFPAGVPVLPQPLSVTAYDSNNNPILTNVSNTFATPIVIVPSPAGEGVSVSLNGATCSTSTSTSVSIGCAADLNKVEFAYDGTTTPDPNDHVVDTFTISTTTQQGNPTPSPATVVLESNVISYPISTGGQYLQGAFLTALSSGQLLYLAVVDNEGNEGLIGTFTPSTATLSAPVTLNDVESPTTMAVAPNGTFFVVDSEESIDCWNSVSSALSGSAPSASFTPPPDTYGYSPQPYAITVDGANNAWLVGYEYESETYQDFATYFPAASGCTGSPAFAAYITLNADTSDASQFISPLSNGMAYQSQNGQGLYTATTANAGGTINAITPALGSGSGAGGVGSGGNGTVYAAYYNYGSSGDVETLPSGGSSLTSLLSLVPTSPVSGDGPEPDGLSVFSLNGTPDRISYVDGEFYMLGVIGNLTTTPTTMLISLPNTYNVFQSAHNSKGGEYVLYNDSSNDLYLARSIQTTTWNVPVTSIATGECGNVPVMSINQRAPSSGPFTLGFPSGGSATPMPGAYNDQVLTPPGSGAFPVTVTDNGGRTETYSMTVTNNEGC